MGPPRPGPSTSALLMNTAFTPQQTKTIIPMTRSGAARWPTSDRNPGRLRIGTGGRLHIGMHGRLRRNPHPEAAIAAARDAVALLGVPFFRPPVLCPLAIYFPSTLD